MTPALAILFALAAQLGAPAKPSEPEAQAEAPSPKARASHQPAVGPGDETSIETLHRHQQEVFRAALASAAPFIVRIETIGGAPLVRRTEEGGQETVETVFRQADGPTTGVVWSADGHIITSSFNFIQEPRIITVTLADGRRLLAKLIARDEPARLALLKVQSDSPLSAVTGESAGDRSSLLQRSQLRPGQWTLVGGFGFGSREPAMSVGIISGLDRMAGLAVQTDARISPANYGGPLIDLEGRVIGVCVPMGMGDDELAGLEWYDSGISFAVTADRIERMIGRMKRGETIRRGFMGVGLDNTDADERGVPILGDPLGPAAEAGLKKGDLITHINGQPARTYAALRRRLMGHPAGDAIEVTWLRDGQEQSAELRLVAQADLPVPPASQPAP